MNSESSALIVTEDSLTGLGLKAMLAERFSLPATWTSGWDDILVTDASTREIECVFCDDTAAESIPAVLAGRRSRVVILRETEGEHPRYPVLNVRDRQKSLIGHLAGLLEHIRGKRPKRHGALSEREISVLTLLARGLINKEIADQLGISVHTVISHRKNISAKLGIRTVSGLTVYATIHGYVSPGSVV